jgi:hypothetical protein
MLVPGAPIVSVLIQSMVALIVFFGVLLIQRLDREDRHFIQDVLARVGK